MQLLLYQDINTSIRLGFMRCFLSIDERFAVHDIETGLYWEWRRSVEKKYFKAYNRSSQMMDKIVEDRVDSYDMKIEFC